MSGKTQVLYAAGSMLIFLGIGTALRETWHNLAVTALVSLILSVIFLWSRERKTPGRKP
jgi:hypothetical protein